MIIKLVEDFNPSMPRWLINYISQKVGKYNDSGIDWNRATYHEDELPVSSRDPRLKDPNRISVFRLDNGRVVIPYVSDEEFYLDGHTRPFSKTPWKSILNHTTDYGYFDLSEKSTKSSEYRKDKGRRPKYEDEYNNAYKIINDYNKSDYDPKSVIDDLRDYKYTGSLIKIISDYYSRIDNLGKSLKEKFSKIQLDDSDSNIKLIPTLIYATKCFGAAVSKYSSLIKSIKSHKDDFDDPDMYYYFKKNVVPNYEYYMLDDLRQAEYRVKDRL